MDADNKQNAAHSTALIRLLITEVSQKDKICLTLITAKLAALAHQGKVSKNNI